MQDQCERVLLQSLLTKLVSWPLNKSIVNWKLYIFTNKRVILVINISFYTVIVNTINVFLILLKDFLLKIFLLHKKQIFREMQQECSTNKTFNQIIILCHLHHNRKPLQNWAYDINIFLVYLTSGSFYLIECKRYRNIAK